MESNTVLWVGLACAVAAFLWIVGFLIGIRTRGQESAKRAAAIGIVVAYFAIVSVLAGLVLWKKDVTSEGIVDKMRAAFVAIGTEALNASLLRGEDGGGMDSAPRQVVTRVIDGDTVDVTTEDGVVRVRILGIDTPEVFGGKECYGPEASEYMASRLDEAVVVLVADATQGDADAYDRLLRYVEREDGTDVGLELIRLGYATEYTYDAPYERQTEYRAAEASAKMEKRGLWSACY